MIDKSLRSRYQWGGPGGKSPGTSSSGGSRGGGGPPGDGDRQMTYSAPAPSPHRDNSAERAAQAVADALNAQRAVEATARENEARETAREKAIQVAALTTKTPTRSPHKDTQEQIVEQKILDDYGYQDAKAKAPTTFEPKIEKYITHSPFTDEPIINERLEKYSPTYYQDRSKIGGETYGERAEAGIKRGGIGNILKNVALGVVAPQLLAGTKWGTGLNLYNKYQTAKKYVPKIGDIETALKSNLNLNKNLSLKSTQRPKGMPEHLGERGFRTRKETPGDKDGVQPTLAQIITGGTGLKSGQDLLGLDNKQVQQIYQGRDLLKQTIESGMYQNRKLNMNEMKMLQGHMMKLENLIQAIEKAQAPVEVAHGGRIDSPLVGRSRDI